MIKKFYTIALFTALIAGTFSAHAQLDNLRNKVRAKKDNSSQTDKSSSSSSSSSDEAQSPSNSSSNSGNSSRSKRDKSGSDEATKSTAHSEADFKEQPFPPTIELFSVLDGGLHIDLNQPFPYIGILEAVFLPTKNVNGGPLFAESSMPANDEVIIYGQIKDKGGNVIYKQALTTIGHIRPITSINHSDWHSIEIADRNVPWAAGDYNFEVTITGKVIFTMPFQVIVGKNDDPYANKKEIRMIDGYWSKYACYKFDKSSEVFTWISWETNMNMKFKGEEHESSQSEYEVQLYYNGKPYSNLVKDKYTLNRGAWEQKHLTFTPVNDKNNNYIKRDDMKDGNYVMKVKKDGKNKEYPFTIKDGKPVYIAEQDKTKTPDMAKVFEGANQTVWLKPSKS